MLTTLDRYIIRQFLGTFFFILVVIMLIAVVFDISEKTEDFAQSNATVKEIALDYYVNFVLYYSNFFSGLFIFLAVLLFTSRLAGRSEVIAMLSSGVSFPRFVRPYFIAATFLTVVSLYVNVFLLPAIQTDSGFSAVSDDFAERVIGNTTTKMYFRVGTTQAAEKASELIGKTRRVARTQTTNTSSSTSSQYVQISPQRMGGEGISGGISEREEEVPLVEPDVLTSLAIGEAILQYEGNKIYDIVVPIVGLSKECRGKLGPLRLNHRRKVKTQGLNLVGRWQDFVSTPVQTRVGKRKDKSKNVDEYGYRDTP